MSVSIFFHSDPVTVSHVPHHEGGFIGITCKDVTVYVGGSGNVAVANADALADALLVAAGKLRRAELERKRIAAEVTA